MMPTMRKMNLINMHFWTYLNGPGLKLTQVVQLSGASRLLTCPLGKAPDKTNINPWIRRSQFGTVCLL